MTADSRQPGSLTPAENDLAFFGKITASVTHELNNVISIIDQTAGLLDDLVAGEERGIPIATERLSEMSATIQRQTQRGLKIIERLNRFAHSADTTAMPFDLDEVVGNLVELCRRPASLRRVLIEHTPAAGPIRIAGNPFALMQLVFGALQIAIVASPPDSTISLVTATEQDRPVVLIRYAGGDPPDPERMAILHGMTASLGASVQADNTSAERLLRLHIPACPPDRT